MWRCSQVSKAPVLKPPVIPRATLRGLGAETSHGSAWWPEWRAEAQLSSTAHGMNRLSELQ